MSVWLTYSLGDFLLFSPQTYFRLLELYNRAVWPAQLPAAALGAALLLLLRRPGVADGRAICAILAACWLWVAWAYLHRQYATINWAADYAAIAFALQAAVLLALAALGRSVFRVGADLAGLAGLALLLAGLVLLPLLGVTLGRPWQQAPLFGLAPDPTAVATLGMALLAARRRHLALLAAVPLLWTAVSALTLWAMEAPEAWALIVAGGMAAAGSCRRLAGRRSSS
ncbi:MAG TPA: DUF6064 family protein [Geminicoccaceae bacterium]|nr:DUF6064 family protein [Geminicoccus sp.]HMU48459.1 DUF6064 family protein [Geminicoccaceae bacterium]